MTLVSCSSVKNIIQSLSTKTCSLNPLFTIVIKNYVHLLSPMIPNIVNQSLTTGGFPSVLKLSHVRPVWKILRTIDCSQDVVLVLLDLSASLDTIDHTILVKRLESYFGFSKLALCWFRSYLENRRQLIVIRGQVSTPYALRYGVPQGYVLVSLLFALYIVPLQDVIAHHNLNSLFMQITLNYWSYKSGFTSDCHPKLYRGCNTMEHTKHAKK